MTEDAYLGDTHDVADPVLQWAADSIGSGAEVIGARRLSTHGGPWLLRFGGDGITEAVLKYGRRSECGELYACEAAALRFAVEHGISAPRVLAFTPRVIEGNCVALLLSRLRGTTEVPRVASVGRLCALAGSRRRSIAFRSSRPTSCRC